MFDFFKKLKNKFKEEAGEEFDKLDSDKYVTSYKDLLEKSQEIEVTDSDLIKDVREVTQTAEDIIEKPTYVLPTTTILSSDKTNRFTKLVNKINEQNTFLVPIGTYNNQLLVKNLNELPNLLVCGTVMSGKSTFLNSIITSILMTRKPSEVKLVLIDPKKVEFSTYEDLPHLLTPIVNDPKKASVALKQIVAEMDKRYALFSNNGVKNITGYNEYIESHKDKGLERLPYIVCVIDDLVDMMIVAAKEVEDSIMRITTLGFKAGISIVISCNVPNSEVLSSLIKANFPARLCFRVASTKNSQVILDEPGAESLVGYGRALYKDRNYEKAIRINTSIVNDSDIELVCAYIKKMAKPDYDTSFENTGFQGCYKIGNSDDKVYNEIEKYAIEAGQISISKIQRKFNLGFNKAADYLDQLEENGIVEASTGSSKPRKVLVSRDDYER